jgi:hypothetical protein
MIEQFRFHEALPSLKPFPYFERGGGVFRMWRAVAENDHQTGIWTYLFFDSAGFMVEHSASKN